MAFTQAQLRSIMATRGNAFIPRDKLPYAARVAETWTRKKIYRLEDQAALAEFKLLKSAYADIRQRGDSIAYDLGLDNLSLDAKTRRWKDTLNDAVRARLQVLARDIAYSAYSYAVQAYQLGYYGRLWGIQQGLKPDVHAKVWRLSDRQVGAKVLGIHEMKTEIEDTFVREASQSSFQADTSAYALYGTAWEQTYQDIFTKAAGKISRTIDTAIASGSTISQALNAVAAPLGVTSKPTAKTSAAYYESQLNTRTGVIRSSNQASVAASQQNEDLLLGAMWVTAHDDRVCPICAPHDGQIFVLNDLTGIAIFGLPPDGTHYGCRCGMVGIILPSLQGDKTAPPEDTFDEWAMDNGLYTELDWLFADKKLESSVI
jgi:SPP1 gp7 family putative phage head morphogenesis protein